MHTSLLTCIIWKSWILLPPWRARPLWFPDTARSILETDAPRIRSCCNAGFVIVTAWATESDVQVLESPRGELQQPWPNLSASLKQVFCNTMHAPELFLLSVSNNTATRNTVSIFQIYTVTLQCSAYSRLLAFLTVGWSTNKRERERES